MINISLDSSLIIPLVYVNMFKQTVDYYTSRGSHVFTCFVDFSQAFDSVNYWKLFNKLLDDKIDVRIVSILMHWYIKQEACVH